MRSNPRGRPNLLAYKGKSRGRSQERRSSRDACSGPDHLWRSGCRSRTVALEPACLREQLFEHVAGNELRSVGRPIRVRFGTRDDPCSTRTHTPRARVDRSPPQAFRIQAEGEPIATCGVSLARRRTHHAHSVVQPSRPLRTVDGGETGRAVTWPVSCFVACLLAAAAIMAEARRCCSRSQSDGYSVRCRSEPHFASNAR